MPHFPEARRPSRLAGPLCMLVSACGFTAMNLLLKHAMGDFSVWDVGFYRFAGGLVVLLPIVARSGNPFRSPDWKLLVLRGCTGSVAFVFFIFSVRLLPVSTALVLLYVYPAFAAIFAARLYHEPVSRPAWFCIAAVLAGVVILVDPGRGADATGILCGLLSALCAGLTIAVIRRLKQTHGSVIIYLYFCLVGALVTLPAYIVSPTLPAALPQALMCGGIVLSSILGQLMMNHGFDYCRSWEGGLYLTSELILTALAGILLFGDPVGWRFFTGGGLILGSALLLQLEQVFNGGNRAEVPAGNDRRSRPKPIVNR
jgi:drug/metabolite transporter (DMT)-like permease